MTDIRLLTDLDIPSLLFSGFLVGVLISFSIGIFAYGIRYAIRFLKS